MRRGEKPLTAILSIESKTIGTKGKKGILLEKRNDALASRFYYYFSLSEFRYEACISRLSDEFHLGENTIEQILVKRQAFIKHLKDDETDLKQLQKQYPAWQWRLLKTV